MLQQIIENKLQQLHKPFKYTGKEFIMTTCLSPTHNEKHPSFSINVETGKGFCFACGYKVTKDFWITDEVDEEVERSIFYQRLKNKLITAEMTNGKYNIKDDVILPPKHSDISFLCKDNKYRGIPLDVYNKLEVYYCNVSKYKNRIVFPIKENERVVAFTTRTLENNSKVKYIHSKGFNSKEIIYPYKFNKNFVVLVEGVFDAITLYHLNIPVICNWGVALNYNQNKIAKLLKNSVDTIYIALDNDQAGIKATKQFLESDLNEYFEVKEGKQLYELKDFYKSKYKDINEWFESLS